MRNAEQLSTLLNRRTRTFEMHGEKLSTSNINDILKASQINKTRCKTIFLVNMCSRSEAMKLFRFVYELNVEFNGCFFFLFFLVLFNVASNGLQRFAEQPKYTEVNPGEDALLTCKIIDKRGSCSWQKDNKVCVTLRFQFDGNVYNVFA